MAAKLTLANFLTCDSCVRQNNWVRNKKVQRLQQQQRQQQRRQQRQQQRRRQRQQHRFISRKMMNVLSFILPLIMRSFDKLIDVFVVVVGVTAAALLETHLHIEGQS